MSNKKFCLGLDYGTQSGRAVLVEVDTGNIVAVSVKEYTHGVMDRCLPDGTTKLEHSWALQHPEDYIEVLQSTIPEVIKKAKIEAADVIGLSVDFTSCTMLPIDKEGMPLCFKSEYKSNPHAYVKLWKHHAAQDEADRINETASGRGEIFLERYGGKISSEWFFPKVMQILNETPEVYYAADRFIEAGDWISLILTGNERRNSCAAGYKAMWDINEGYPSKEFFKMLHPELENVVSDKMKNPIYSIGGKAGELTTEMGKLTGLLPGTAVGISGIDAHVAVPAVGIVEPEKMCMIIGTSTCHMVLSKEKILVPGICGVVKDGIIPGFYGYEAGQSCVGDHFEWFVNNCVPSSYILEAENRGISIYMLLGEKATKLKPGDSGLLALDWWNGNRSVLVDADLTGMIVGLTLTTKPEEIYRTLIEATAFGTNMIIENFENNGIKVRELYACGGIAEKDELMMQIYSDVTNRDIRIAASFQSVALGAAMFGAVAAGKDKGGYDTIVEAARSMAKIKDNYYKPIPGNADVYRKLYNEYKRLHDYYGRGVNNVMKVLRSLKS
jgi:L-ribulokinase